MAFIIDRPHFHFHFHASVAIIFLFLLLPGQSYCQEMKDVNLNKMYYYLRHDDTRLVRYNVPSSEAERRQKKTCSKYLRSLMDFLIADTEKENETDDKLKVIQILTLCSNSNPAFREQIGTHREGKVLDEVIRMIDDDDDNNNNKAAAVVGEAIWIFSFNNLHIHNYFVQNGAIQKMVSIIITKTKTKLKLEFADDDSIDSNSDSTNVSKETLAVMWVAAALQNLAASYCATDSGHCWWEYNHDRDPGLHLHEESPVVIDSTIAARKIMEAGRPLHLQRNDDDDDEFQVETQNDLIEILLFLVCREPMTEDDDQWPSLATIHDTIRDPRMSTWAITGLIKNLSMYSVSVNVAHLSKDCLCKLTESEDWLESSKAEDALYRLGIEECWEEEEYNYEGDEL